MLSVQNVSFSYNEKPTLRHFSFEVKEGEVLAVVGESGSGKSTLLKLIYGEYDVNQGSISWKKENILGPKNKLVVGHDFMKYVSQEFDLMPFITVAENIGSHLSNFFPKQKQKRTEELLAIVGLSDYSSQKVKDLSGGQKQRVALAKALAKQPEIILLDEPFSHIDSFKKMTLRKDLFRFLRDNNIACVVATHDKDDVLSFADSMMVLHNGQVISKNTPRELYYNTKDPITAAFFSEFCIIDDHIIYAHQISVCKKSDKVATVLNSYFKGHFFLVEASYKEQKIVFEHNAFLAPGSDVFIALQKM